MVYYFTSNVIDPPATLYVGKDKFESQTFRPSNQAPQADQPAQTKSSSNSAGTAMSGEHHLPTDPKLLELTIKSFPQGTSLNRPAPGSSVSSQHTCEEKEALATKPALRLVPRRQPLLSPYIPSHEPSTDMGCLASHLGGGMRAVDQGEFH